MPEPVMRLRRSALDMVTEARSRIENLSVEQVAREVSDDGALLVDIRDVRERILRGAIPGAVHVDRGLLEFWVDPASPYHRAEVFDDAARRIILYCAGGGRSALAARTLQEMGFTNVAHLEAGFSGWEAAGRPVEDVASTSKWVRREDPAPAGAQAPGA